MKIVFASDIHLVNLNPPARLDFLPDTQKYKMKKLLNIVRKNEAMLLISGDLVDKPRSWYLLPDIMDLLKEYTDIKIGVVYGQHDTYYYNKETRHATNLGILEKAGLLTILEEHPYMLGGVHIYGTHVTQRIPDVVDESKFNILVIHAPISDVALFSTHNYINAKDFINEHTSFDMILCGDIHKRFQIKSDDNKRIILNTGPLLRIKGTEYNMTHKPGVYIIDTDLKDVSWTEIEHEPAKKVLTRTHILNIKESNETLDKIITQIKGKEVKIKPKITDNIFNYINANKIDLKVENLFKKLIKETKNVH